ncbi:MAG: glycoside hydrolase family 95 protein [Lachnospiraceae bacterium]|nr:glycoside hydrolase family 95 protein [Lachnospiraceae bacterium]
MRFKGLKSINFAKNWDEAFPVGSGTVGGLVFGEPYHEKIVTNHEELFLPLPDNSDLRNFKGAHLIPKVREMILEGKYLEATQYFEKGLGEDGYPVGSIIWTNCFETATDIYIDSLKDGEAKDYFRRLDFANGECSVSFSDKNGRYLRKTFVSRTRNILCSLITAEEGELDLHIYTDVNEGIHDMESTRAYVEGDMIIGEGVHAEEESGYVSALKVISDTKKEVVDNGFEIHGAKEVMLLYTLTPWKKRPEASKVKIVRSLNDTLLDYDELLREHVVIHKELFERTKITFSESDKEYTTEELRAMCTPERLCPELMERMADFGRYLEIASFGKLPPNLQGVWNGTANPPWSSDYTLDENVQMMIWQVLPGSLPEFARTYFDWLESYTEDFRKNAKSYYGARGIFCAPRVALNGLARHFGILWPMLFWTAGAGWLSSVYEDYYEYTGDKNILLRGVKYWKEVVLFYEDFLVTDEKGKFMFIPSYSPENTPLGNDSPTAINATMDVAIAKEVYRNLINACELLGVEEENLPKWKEEYKKFPDYAINEDGAIKEWIPEFLKDDYHHRHSSHLYPVFPGREALESGNEELLAACHRAAELRLLDGVDAISGWGLAHLANISARIKDSKLWYMALNRLIQKFTLDNLFTGHNEHSLFQMDANLGITAAVIEAFYYSDMEKLEFFPILCDEFEYMCAEGFRGRGCLHVVRLEKKKNELFVIIENQGKNTMKIVCPEGYSFENGDRTIEIRPGKRLEAKADRRN